MLLGAFGKDEKVPRHHVHCDVPVQVLEGEMVFTTYTPTTTEHRMKAGDLIGMTPNTEHSLRGITLTKIRQKNQRIIDPTVSPYMSDTSTASLIFCIPNKKLSNTQCINYQQLHRDAHKIIQTKFAHIKYYSYLAPKLRTNPKNNIMNRKLLKVSALLFVLFTMISCSNENEVIPEPYPNAELANGHVPVAVQRENLRKILANPQISQSIVTPETRAAIDLNHVQSFGRDGQPLTRSQEEDAFFYLFDLDGMGNYALMGANVTIPPLLAIVDKDKDISEEMRKVIAEQEPDLANFPESLEGIAIGGATDSAINNEDIVKVYDYYNADYTLVGRRPLTNKWNQLSPFNTLMPYVTSYNYSQVHAAVGCLPLSVALIMSDPIYNIQPFGSEQITFNWGKMLQYETMGQEATDPSFDKVVNEDFPTLFKILTERQYNNIYITAYREWSSLAATSSAAGTFRNFGLTNNGFVSYNLDDVIEALSQGYPILMAGYDPDSEDGSGHAWVCSAAIKAKVPYTYRLKSELGTAMPPDIMWEIEDKILLHHNFGWSGNCNGYYLTDMSIDTSLGGVLNDNLTPNRRKPEKGWGNFKDLDILINKNK